MCDPHMQDERDPSLCGTASMRQHDLQGWMTSCTTRRRVHLIDLQRSLVLYVIAAGVAVTWYIPAAMSRRAISAL
jgi:hypothetical protein